MGENNETRGEEGPDHSILGDACNSVCSLRAVSSTEQFQTWKQH